MKRLSLNTLTELGLWTSIFGFTVLTVVASGSLVILLSYWLTGDLFDKELLIVGLVTPAVISFAIAWTGGRLKQHPQSRQRETEDDLILLLDALDLSIDPYFLIDSTGHFIKSNTSAYTLLGYTEQEFMQMEVSDIDVDHNTEVWPELFDSLKERKAMRFRSRHRTKDGRILPVEITADHLHFKGKEYALAFTRDISQRERVEKALSEQRKLLRSVIDESPDPIIVKDKDAKFILVNTACARLYGSTPEEMIGKDDGDYIPDQEQAEFFRQNVKDIMQKGETEIVFEESIDVETGERRLYRSVKKPYINSQGESQILILAHDITEEKAVERRLRQNEQFLQSAFDSIQDGISILDQDFNVLKTNRRLEHIYSNSSVLLGKKCYQAYQGNEEICSFCPAVDTFASGKTKRAVIPYSTIENPDGWIDLSVFPIKDDDDKVISVIEYVKDITQERKAEEAFRLMQYALDQISEAYYLIDRSGHLLKVNNRACLDLGYTKVELEGMPLADITDIFEETRWPERMAEIRQKGAITYETRYKRKDGSHFPVEVNTSYLEYKAESYIVALVHDITERVQEQEELRLMEYALEHMSEAYLLVDETSHFRRVNEAACAALGYSREELIRMKVIDIDPDFPKEQWDDEFNEIKRQGSFTKESRHKRKDGSIFPVEISINNILYQGKNYILGLVRDLSERKAAEKKMREQEEMLIAQSRSAAMGEMISMISHQWRQPLTVISMSANNLLIDIEFQEAREDTLKAQAQNIIKQTKHLSQTIDDFRDFFRPDKDVEEVSLREVMDEAEKIIGDSLRNNSIAFTVDVKDDHKFMTYSRELLQVYVNLINNAKEVLLDNKVQAPKITVELAEKSGQALTTICDNGGGIDGEIIEKIFDPYFTTKGVSSGTGLGLYISKIIVEKHLKGTITTQNSVDGACFVISIPMDFLESR